MYHRETEMCFVSVAFGDKRYKDQQIRLMESIDRTNPGTQGFHWTDELPPGAQPFLNSLYGFKVHAVLHAYNEGYRKIIFLDPACIVQGDVQFYFAICKKHGVVAIKDDNKLMVSNTALQHFNRKRDDVANLHLVGGSLYVFHFPHSDKVFHDWYHAERAGVFGSQFEAASEKLQGHRYDETCMALALDRNGFQPVAVDVGSYNFNGAVITKQHFK